MKDQDRLYLLNRSTISQLKEILLRTQDLFLREQAERLLKARLETLSRHSKRFV